ncbi:unnamed protein product [Camellia sinensis]
MILTPSSSKSTVHKNPCFSDSLLYIHARWFSSPPYGQSVSRPFSTRTMSSCSSESPPPTLRTVTISYSPQTDKNIDLSAKIEEGFGPNGLGILSISDLLACLPEDVKKELEDPNSSYILKGSFYANPIFDTPTTDESLVQRYPSYCGSNIWPDRALPELEVAFKALGKLILDVGLMVAYHCDRYGNNTTSKAAREGSSRIQQQGADRWVGRWVDRLVNRVSRGMKMHEDEGLEQILLRSRCHKDRLLCYFPSLQRIAMEEIEDEFLMGHKVKEIKKAGKWHENVFTQNGESMSSWCGWHTDHGSLTGLTRGMFMRDAVELPCPDSAAGLYIKTRNDQIVVFGEDEIAYQIGETTEILSRGHLCATPHCVRAPKGEEASGIERSTFALFMQPDCDGGGDGSGGMWHWDEKLNFPEVVHIHQESLLGEEEERLCNGRVGKRVVVGRGSLVWEGGIVKDGGEGLDADKGGCLKKGLISSYGSLTFGEYTEKLLDKYYHLKA